MKRYDLELTATGPVMEERQEGAFVPFSEVGPLNQRINQLLEERNSTGIAISNAILSGVVPDKHPLRSRLELLANHHKREQELKILLREVTKVIPAIGVAIDDLPVVDAFLERIEAVLAGKLPYRQDTEWTDATTSPVAADYRELQEQHDQLQSRLKGALDTLKLALPYVEHAIEYAPSQQISDGHKIFAAHITAALTGDCGELFTMMQEQNPADTLVLMSDIASLQRYTLGGHCDSFGQDCGAEMEQDDEGEYILLAEALTLPAAAIPSGGEPCATEPPSSNPD